MYEELIFSCMLENGTVASVLEITSIVNSSRGSNPIFARSALTNKSFSKVNTSFTSIIRF